MKTTPVLVTLATLLLGAAALQFATRPPTASDLPMPLVVDSTIASFRNEVRPIAEYDLNSLTEISARELRDPAFTMPQFHRFEREQLVTLLLKCDAKKPSDAQLEKDFFWRQFECGTQPLTKDFFERPPYMSVTGKSFVQLAFAKQTYSPDWLAKHAQYVHVNELRELDIKSTPSRALLAQLPPRIVSEINHSASMAAYDKLLLLRKQNSDGLYFDVYEMSEWKRHVAARGLYVPFKSKSKFCGYERDNFCWQWDTGLARSHTRRMMLCLGFSIAFFAVAGLRTLRQQIKLRKKVQKREDLMLQTLTHELRTPIASLLLVREAMRAEFDNMNEKSQANFLRMSEDIQRLHRLTEASQQYLIADDIALAQTSVAEFHQFVLDLIESQDFDTSKVEKVGGALCDPYWFGVCLRNLIDNAKRHGRAPYSLAVKREIDFVHVIVADAGELASVELADLQSARTQNRGLGIGLSIVSRLMNAMGGALYVQHKPTRFTLVVKAHDDKNPVS